ncbi:MAG: ScyD/ScyE family protein [Actinomycetota bacterium]|nr:ScyD/ScyE family protein [Actinomycetota bacterium]
MTTNTAYGISFPTRSTSHTRTLSAAAALSLVVAGSLMTARPAHAAPPTVADSGRVTVVARNLDNPRGLAFGSHDDLYIAESGHGGSLCLGDGPTGPQCAGLTSGMSKLVDGRLTKVLDGLISVASPDGTAAAGLSAVSTQGSRIYGQMAASSAGVPPTAPPGPVVRAAKAELGRTISIDRHGSWSALAPTGNRDYAWTNHHQYLQPDQFPDANPNALLTVGRTQYVADAGSNLIAKVDDQGRVSTWAYLTVPAGSVTDGVPTCIAKAPDGSFYVGELLGGEYAPGHARVWRIANGVASVKWSGFTGIQGCGFDDSGNFYATEFQANGMFGPDPSGALIKVAPNGTRTTLGAGQLSFPSGFAYDDGAVYVSNWSIMPAANAGGPTGEVVRIAVDD